MDEELYDRIVHSLTNHTPHHDQTNRIEAIREAAKTLAYEIAHYCPNSRERSLAVTHLEETVMWAVKSVVLEVPMQAQ